MAAVPEDLSGGAMTLRTARPIQGVGAALAGVAAEVAGVTATVRGRAPWGRRPARPWPWRPRGPTGETGLTAI
ncbi:hypothetical protein [Streptomyces sennicomposti]